MFMTDIRRAVSTVFTRSSDIPQDSCSFCCMGKKRKNRYSDLLYLFFGRNSDVCFKEV